MKILLRLFILVLAWVALLRPGTASGQTPTLEFAPGAGNPTGNGATTADQVITLQNNTDNPTGTTFVAYTPTTTVTFALSNQQYFPIVTRASTGTGVAFGENISGTGLLNANAPLFSPLNTYGGATAANFTSTSGVVGGISATANYGTEIFLTTEALNNPVPANARYQFADLTLTFSQPMVNPVIHVSGMGGNFNTVGFSTELDLLTTGVTLSRLSGSTELNINATQILNSATNPGPNTGAGAASGSVLVTTGSAGITTLVFRLYLRTGATGGDINGNTLLSHTGDAWLMSVSRLTPIALTGYVFEDVNYGGGAGRPRTATGAAVRSGATVELYDNAGTFVATTTTDATG
ncbi:MAG TPA: hypothetical protein VF630_10415, partial [Hymenobacter sp.]